MSQLHLSDEILMAFADGQLDEPVATAVEQALVNDPIAIKRVVDFVRSRRLARSAFSSEVTLDVPPALYAAVAARVSAFEADEREAAQVDLHKAQAGRSTRWPLSRTSMAASVAAIALAAGAYLAGQQGLFSDQSQSLIAKLGDPAVHDALDRNASGQEAELPVGLVRMVSTYRVANGSLCREFQLHSPPGVVDAVACRAEQWNVTFALANAGTNTTYTPSNGAGLIPTYLQNIGAGEPLVDAAEIRALAEGGR